MTKEQIIKLYIADLNNLVADSDAKINRIMDLEDELEALKKGQSLPIDSVSVSLPSVDDAGIIAVEIAEINNEMTAQEQAFFIAGFSECIKYLKMQSNER